MTYPRCDIILPVCDQFQFTRNCIDSIAANTDTPYRIIVINNGKNEETKAYLSGMKNRLGDRLVIVQNQTNIGWVKALNRGIAIADAPFLCFQNDDTVVTRGWLRKMIKILESGDKIGLANPVWEGRPKRMSIDDYGALIEARSSGRYIETDWARGFSVVFKKEVVDRIGNVDEIYGLAYFDDVDFSVRAIRAGFLVVLALDTYVYHHRNVTFFEVLKGKKWNELHEKNKLIFYGKWGRPLRIAMILDKYTCKDDSALKRVIETAFYLARKQNHIDIWSPRDIRSEFCHTNLDIRSCNAISMGASAFFNLCANARKKEGKRYSGAFSFDRRLGKFLDGNGLLKDIPVYTREAGKDFNELIRNEVDAMQERTRKGYPCISAIS